MSAWSDWQCGAITEEEYRSYCRDEALRDEMPDDEDESEEYTVTDKDIITGLECMTGKLRQDHMRLFIKTRKEACHDCVYEYRRGKEICMRVVAADVAGLLQERGCEDQTLLDAMRCIGCITHKQPAIMYEKYRQEECSKCKCYGGNYKCESHKACEAALTWLTKEKAGD